MGTDEGSAISWSIKNGDVDEVVKRVNSCNSNTSVDGRSPLHFAADFGRTKIISHLVSVGADVNAVDGHGITPLLAAIWENHLEAVELLLSLKATLDGRSPDGRPYLDCAETKEMKELLTRHQQRNVS